MRDDGEHGERSGTEGPADDRWRAADESQPERRGDGALAPSPAQLEALAGALLWRIGRAYDDGPLTVRLGFASAAPLFAELPRLRPASDLEVEIALQSGDVTVEWVGPRGTARS
jgi:hypothetical protein